MAIEFQILIQKNDESNSLKTIILNFIDCKSIDLISEKVIRMDCDNMFITIINDNDYYCYDYECIDSFLYESYVAFRLHKFDDIIKQKEQMFLILENILLSTDSDILFLSNFNSILMERKNGIYKFEDLDFWENFPSTH
jgi:hypothetical protein